MRVRLFPAVILLVTLFAAAASGATVRLEESAVVEKARVTLGEIAFIEGAATAERARLAAVVVAYVPPERGAIEIRSETVRDTLDALGFNLAGIALTGAVSTRVEMESAGVLRAVARAAERHLRASAPRAHFALSDVALDFVPPEDFTPVATAVRPAAAAGPVRFDIADAADPTVTLGHARARLEKSVPAIVARRGLPGGRRIQPGDIEIAYVPAEAAAGVFTDASEVTGRRTAAAVPRGRPLTAACLEEEPAVERGEEVLLEVRRGALTVSKTTRARESGLVGDVVRLREVRGRGEYLATVTGRGRAVPLSGGGQ